MINRKKRVRLWVFRVGVRLGLWGLFACAHSTCFPQGGSNFEMVCIPTQFRAPTNVLYAFIE